MKASAVPSACAGRGLGGSAPPRRVEFARAHAWAWVGPPLRPTRPLGVVAGRCRWHALAYAASKRRSSPDFRDANRAVLGDASDSRASADAVYQAVDTLGAHDRIAERRRGTGRDDRVVVAHAVQILERGATLSREVVGGVAAGPLREASRAWQRLIVALAWAVKWKQSRPISRALQRTMTLSTGWDTLFCPLKAMP